MVYHRLHRFDASHLLTLGFCVQFIYNIEFCSCTVLCKITTLLAVNCRSHILMLIVLLCASRTHYILFLTNHILSVIHTQESAVSIDYGVALPPIKKRKTVTVPKKVIEPAPAV